MANGNKADKLLLKLHLLPECICYRSWRDCGEVLVGVFLLDISATCFNKKPN